jgi:hypothetical protein
MRIAVAQGLSERERRDERGERREERGERREEQRHRYRRA